MRCGCPLAVALGLVLGTLCAPLLVAGGPGGPLLLGSTRQSPRHPTLILGEVKGKLLPICGASGAKPLGLDGKNTVKLAKNATFRFEQDKRYTPGNITVHNLGTQWTYQVATTMDGVQLGGSMATRRLGDDLILDFVSDVDLRQCYLAIILASRSFLDGVARRPGGTILFKNIGNVTAGKKTDVRVDVGNHYLYGYSVVLLFFSEGHEVRSTCTPLVDLYFDRLEEVSHREILSAYLTANAGRNQPLQLLKSFPPVFDDAAPERSVPQTVKLKIFVDATGSVSFVSAEGPLPASAMDEVRRAVEAWRFLPMLLGGQPVSAQLQTTYDVLYPRVAAANGTPAGSNASQ